jgi:hypothetical protein
MAIWILLTGFAVGVGVLVASDTQHTVTVDHNHVFSFAPGWAERR